MTNAHTPETSGAERAADTILFCSMATPRLTKKEIVEIINKETNAPELLEALELLAHQYQQVCEDNKVMGWPDMIKGVHIIIAKATGKEAL